jgi:hypothetical protein
VALLLTDCSTDVVLDRMYTSTFSDWFSQAVIDYMLGNRNLSVFSEFLLKLQSSDPRDLIRLSRIRAEAIATCVSRVLTAGERLLCGWTVFSPSELNLKFDKFEEKVLLLVSLPHGCSEMALKPFSDPYGHVHCCKRSRFPAERICSEYKQRYDYTLEKVKAYTRVSLKDIIQITKGKFVFISLTTCVESVAGAYILSPLEEASKDPLQNAGFTLSWCPTKQTGRITSYSMRNSIDLSRSPLPTPTQRTSFSSPLTPGPQRRNTGAQLSRVLSRVAEPAQAGDRVFAAFKALPVDPTRSRRETETIVEPADDLSGAKNCKEAVDLMVESIVKACQDVGGGDQPNFVVEEPVVR